MAARSAARCWAVWSAFVAIACTPASERLPDARSVPDAALARDGSVSEPRDGGPRVALGSADAEAPRIDAGSPCPRYGATCGGCGVVRCVAGLLVCDAPVGGCPAFAPSARIPWPTGESIPLVGMGIGIGDLDGDGRVDAVVAGLLHPHLAWGDARGVRTPRDAPLASLPGHDHGVSLVDVDGDGDLDVFLTMDGGMRLLRNDAGVLTDGSRDVGLPSAREPGGPAWADYDGDGDLDVFVPDYFGAPSKLLRNDGTTFVDVAWELGVDLPEALSFQAAWLDYDGDGDPDLFVTNDKGDLTGQPCSLFRNDGGTFTDVGRDAGITELVNAMGIAVGDVDGDLDLDILVTDIGTIDGGQLLYINRGDGTFENRAALHGADAAAHYAWGAELLDLDNDGDLDLLVGSQSPDEIFVAENLGDGIFVEIGPIFDTPIHRRQVGLASGDFDADGRLDIALTFHDSSDMLARFYRNIRPGVGHHLRVALRAPSPNTRAVGATVEVRAGARTQTRALSVGGSFLSSSEPILHFGLGDATAVDAIEVRWPDGTRSTMTGPIEVDRTITVER